MKKTIALLLIIAMLALTACSMPPQNAAAETAQEETPVGMPKPWREITQDEAAALCPGALRAPEGAENVRWSAMESAGQPTLVQLDFEKDGYAYTAREQQTNDRNADISGMYYTWTEQLAITLRSWEQSASAGTYYRCIGADEWADLCVWYDTAKGVSYSLSVTAKDLDGFDLQAIAEELCAGSGRQDGERFEAVIVLEGMEESVRYEHAVNAALGFEIDYEYERFARQSETGVERFVSIWDSAEEPENYLEITFVAGEAETVAAAIGEALSAEYDIIREERVLARAGGCLHIDASNARGNGGTPDRLQAVSVIPAQGGCLVAAAHYGFESAEGFGRRFGYMLDTLALTERRAGSVPAGTWQTASVGYEANGELQPEYYVRFTAAEVLYGHMADGEFLVDHADPIFLAAEGAGGCLVQAQSAGGVRYSYRSAEGDGSVLEYFESWNEEEFPETYRGGASLNRSE